MRSSDTDGFTLIEMMVVILIMGLLLSLVLTHGPEHSPVLTLRSAAGELAQNLRLARSKAIAGDRAVRFIVDPATQSFGTPDALETLPPGIELTIVAADKRGIVFEPDGSASAGVIWLKAGQLSQQVAVNWLTGQVSVGQVAVDAQN